MSKGVCTKCGEEKELPYLHLQKRWCRECNTEYHRQYYKANRERVNASGRQRYKEQRKDPEWVEKERQRGRKYWEALRHEVFMAYGGYRCACCGESEPQFLSIDHVNNDGADHRRELGYDGNGKGAGGATWRWLKANNFPPGFQVLCMNCNFGKARNGGICPHEATSVPKLVNSGEAQTG